MAKAVELYREALGEFLPDARIQGDPEVAELEGVKYVRLTIEVDPALYGNVDDVLGVKERIFDYVYEKM